MADSLSFIIGNTGEEFIVATWEPDPQILAAEIIKMADRFENWAVPMQEARQVMIESTRRRFVTETDPDKKPWPELSEDYLVDKEKAGFPDQILVRTDAMRTYATSEDAWFVSENAIWFNAFALPRASDGFPYGSAHQAGTIEGGKRTEFNRIERVVFAGGHNSLSDKEKGIYAKGTQGLNLPKREFIGPDITAIGAIEEIFVDHIESTIEIPWGGGSIFYGTSHLGTFPVFGTLPSGQPILKTPGGGYHFGRNP